jgi:alpha-beta hydrolase superfamily lysophospholipase
MEDLRHVTINQVGGTQIVVSHNIGAEKGGNTKALVWIPGRNDYFYHTHVLKHVLDAGYDLFAVDFRRCGRAKNQGDKAHYTSSFEEYESDMDLALHYICGLKDYSNMTLYGHSTGGLFAIYYLNVGKQRSLFDRLLLNSPFFDWNHGYKEIILENVGCIPFLWKWFGGFAFKDTYELQEGGGVNLYTLKIAYNFRKACPDEMIDFDLKSTVDLPVYAGWVREISRVQSLLQKGHLKLSIPICLIYGGQDTVLDPADMDRFTIGKEVSMHYIDFAPHDVFVCDNPEDNSVGIDAMVEFLKNDL